MISASAGYEIFPIVNYLSSVLELFYDGGRFDEAYNDLKPLIDNNPNNEGLINRVAYMFLRLLDVNGDGVQDPEDTAPISGVTINLYRDQNGDGVLQDADGGPFMTTVTNEAGGWEFIGLAPGSYIVQEVL